MEHAGSALERLVSRLEQSLLPPGAVLKAPDFVPDRVTGELREVDATIRVRIGTADLLIMIECRDWATAQSVLWIEQLAQKRNDVNASKAIAVSPTGFSEAARIKARFLGIEIRTVSEVDHETVKGWFLFRKCIVHWPVYDILDVRVLVQDRPGFRVGPARPGRGVRFGWGVTRQTGTILDIWSLTERENGLWDGVPRDGTKVRRQIELFPGGTLGRLAIRWGKREIAVKALRLDVEQGYEERDIPLTRVYGYRNDQEALTESAEFVVRIAGIEEVFTITRDLRTNTERYMRSSLDPTKELQDGIVVTLGDRPLRIMVPPGV